MFKSVSKIDQDISHSLRNKSANHSETGGHSSKIICEDINTLLLKPIFFYFLFIQHKQTNN